MTIEGVMARLDAFVPSDESENIDELRQCVEPLASLPLAARLPAVPAMLSLIERFPDAEMGSPGPVVHEIESIPGYQNLLIDSLLRKPAVLTVWMANRILNSDLEPHAREKWLALLNNVLRHPSASEETKAAAAEFLEFQSS